MGRNWAWHQWEQDLKLPAEVQARLKRGEKVELDLRCKVRIPIGTEKRVREIRSGVRVGPPQNIFG